MTRRPFGRQLSGDQRGVALIEFAFVLPVLFLLFAGGYQFMDAISAYRKVGRTVRTLADLTSQSPAMTNAQADDIINASRQVMSPYSPANAVIRISQIKTDALGLATVDWSRPSSNGTGLTPGSPFALPISLAQPSKYYIYSEIYYTYKPGIASSLIGTIPFSQTIYMSPRGVTSIPYTNN